MSKWKNWKRTKNGGLSYQVYKAYRDCPQKYKWRAAKRPKTDVGDPLNMFLGCVWAKLMEDFYTSGVIEEASKAVKDSGNKDKGRIVVDKFLRARAVHWFETEEMSLGLSWKTVAERKEYLDLLKEQLPKFRDCVKSNKLLGTRTWAEREYGHVLRDFYLNGWADLAYETDKVRVVADVDDEGNDIKVQEVDTKLSIVDGKTTKNPRYLDKDQLYHYSYLNYLVHGKFADHLGFLLFRTGVVRWIDASDKEMEKYISRLEGVMEGIEAKEFTATPSHNSCKFCDWRSGCSEYKAWKQGAENERRKEARENWDPFEDSFGADLVVV